MDGTALVLCEGHFNTPCGKTAHGLVRGTERYRVVGVIDSRHAGRDAGDVLDARAADIPVFESLEVALEQLGAKPDFLVMGVAPDGGMLPPALKPVFEKALRLGINCDSGLHQALGEDADLRAAAAAGGASIRDVRRCKPVSELHFFTGDIEKVGALRVAVLGTDSAVGKRTTARILVNALRGAVVSAEMIGTGQTAWFQGVRYGMLLDATINDFVAGEIEHAVCAAWKNERPRVIVVEGQGCLTNPAFPGGFEILAAARPHAVILQHAPRRRFYDGFPGYEIAGIEREMKIIELMSSATVAAITINHEDMTREEVDAAAAEYEARYGIPAADALWHGPEKIVAALQERFSDAF